MPNVGDLNEFLTPLDVKDGEIITFIDPGTIEEVDYSPARDGSDVKQVLQIGVELANKKTKICNPNKTSRDAIAEKYGQETEKWEGKKARVSLLKQNVRGKIRNVIYLEPIG